jgi:hypothetical protein
VLLVLSQVGYGSTIKFKSLGASARCLILISLAFSRTSFSSRRRKRATSAKDIPLSSMSFKNNRSVGNHGVATLLSISAQIEA